MTHNLADMHLYTGQGALPGFAAFGQPLIFLVFLAVITSRPDPVDRSACRHRRFLRAHGCSAAATERPQASASPAATGGRQLACSASLSFASTEVRCVSEIG